MINPQPETRYVCPCCGMIEYVHLKSCLLGEMLVKLIAVRDALQKTSQLKVPKIIDSLNETIAKAQHPKEVA
jgi:hypothetical protein